MAARVALVLRTGGRHDYQIKHAERLLRLLDVYLPRVPQFVLCDLPDYGGRHQMIYDWPGWWSKMELFRPDIEGDLFYLDLDTTPVADLTPMASVGVLAAISNRGNVKRSINSSCMYLPAQYRARIWKRWMDYGPERAMRDFRGDQDFLYAQFKNRWQRFETLVPGCAVSFKYHVQPAKKVPDGARLVYFHGTPKPWDDAGKLP